MLINDVMTRNAVTCHPDQTLERATNMMSEHDVGFLPVVDSNDVVIGVITDRDILLATYRQGCPLRSLHVDAAMTKFPVTCTVRDEPRQIEQCMAQHQIRRLPVVDDNGKAVGVVTLSDIAQASMQCHELSSRGPSWTLAAITRPRHSAASR